MESLWTQMVEIARNLFSSQELMATLSRPDFTAAAFIMLAAIIFTETGLLIGFFLPGDSLLVTVGLVCSSPYCSWSLPALLVLLSVAAIVGDSVGYSIGYKAGPKIFNREKSLFFHKDHLIKAQEFYDRHGGKTIVLARFMPFIRTFAPVVAGVGKMDYKRFLFFNVFGGIGWVCSMILTGYYLPALLNPPLRHLLDNPGFRIETHIEKVIIVVVFLSISPGIFAWLKSRITRQQPAPSSDESSLRTSETRNQLVSK